MHRFGNELLALLAALFLPARYLGIICYWAMFFYFLYQQRVLRLPLLLYLFYIRSPAGRRQVGRCRWPHLLRHYPLYRYLPHYFKGSRLIKTVDLDTSRRYLMCAHPHGIFANATLLGLGTEGLGFSSTFPGIHLSEGMLDLILQTPFARELCLLHGWCDVSRGTLLQRLSRGPGTAVMILVGGAAEAVLAAPGTMDVVLLKRKGFVKVALQAGADLVPVLAFGENEQYRRIQVQPGGWLDRMQTATKKALGFTLPLCVGRGILGLRHGPWPEPVPLSVVVGAPLVLPKFEGDLNSEEGRALVDDCHARYCQALQQLYDQHKDELAPQRKRDMRLV